MQRLFTFLTLTFLILPFFVSGTAYANENGDVDVAKANEVTDKDRADSEYITLLNANILYLMAQSEYEANKSKIERGVGVTASKLLAETVSVYVSGGITTPAVVSSLVDVLDLAESINASTSLLDAYDAAISKKQGAMSSFESAKTTYNKTYDTYIGVLAGHTGWTSSEVFMYISNDANRRKGIQHKNNESDGKHGVRGRKGWNKYDKSLPSFDCKGPCSVTFTLPSEALKKHKEKCGLSTTTPARTQFDTVGRTVNEGCGVEYWDCPEYPDTKHKIRSCNKWLYTSANSKRRCKESYRKCMYMRLDHNPYDWYNHQSKHSDDDDDDEEGEDTSEVVDNSPDCDSCTTGGCSACPITYACGDHSGSPSESNNHRLLSINSMSGYCTTHAFYACQANDHISVSCSETDANGNTCTVGSYYACQSHTHQFPAPAPVDPNLCPAPDCNVRLNDTNRSEHALVTCTGGSKKSCRQQYYKCQADDHKWLYCQRGSNCPYFIHNQSRYRIRRCMESNNAGGCITVNGKRQPHNVQ